MSERDEAIADRDWWRAVGKEIDPNAQLYGYSYRYRGSFVKPAFEVDGLSASAIACLTEENKRLREELGKVKTGAARDVLAERERQKTVEGFDAINDDAYANGQLADAAVCYATDRGHFTKEEPAPGRWPWSGAWWKPKTRRQDLVRAGALILAEIDRLDRATLRKEGER